MRKLTRTIPLFCALAAVACAPAVNPRMRSATDALLVKTSEARIFDAPASYQPMPWAAGQWVTMKSTSKQGPAVTRLSVASKEADGGFWLVSDVQDYYNHTVTRILYARQPSGADDAMSVVKKMVTVRNDGKPEEMDFTAGGPGVDMMKSLAKMVNVSGPSDATGLPKEDVSVPAGTFKGAARYQTKVSVGPFMEKTFDGWYHPAVPINGGVKSTSTDGELTSELLDFGTSGGAVSAGPQVK